MIQLNIIPTWITIIIADETMNIKFRMHIFLANQAFKRRIASSITRYSLYVARTKTQSSIYCDILTDIIIIRLGVIKCGVEYIMIENDKMAHIIFSCPILSINIFLKTTSAHTLFKIAQLVHDCSSTVINKTVLFISLQLHSVFL